MYKLMIIDDEPLVLSAISKFIQENFPSLIEIHTYEDSQTALYNFQSVPADIVITDIRMPFMDGLQLIQEMQKISQIFIPMIVSGYGEFSYAKKAMQLGVAYYLLKPIDYIELKQNLTAAIYKLQQNQLIYKQSIHSKENQELFFINLTRKQITSEKELIDTYNKLHLPFSLSKCSGIITRINVLSTIVSYHYDLETFSNICENFVRMYLHPQYVCTISRTSSHYDLVLIQPEITDGDYQEICRQAEALLQLKINIQTLGTFSSLFSFISDHKTADVLTDFSDYAISEKSNTINYHDCIKLAIAYIDEHYAEDLTRETVANAVHVSNSYFSTLFKQETGVNFLNYLTEVRMKKAITLLNTNMKIQDIGKAVGYNNQGRFLVNFRNYTSYTPGQYRRDVLKIFY